MPKINKILIFIFLGAFLFSIVYAFYSRIPLAVDAKAYDAIAWNLVQGFGYKENRNLSYEEDYALGRAGPGYEFFLAGVYAVFGHRQWPVWILQSIFHVLSGIFIFLTCRFLFCRFSFQKTDQKTDHIAHDTFPTTVKFLSYEKYEKEGGKERRKEGEKGTDWPAVLGLFLFLFHPDLIQINGMLLTEPLFIFLLAFSSYLGLRLFSSLKSSLIQIILLAVLISFAVLVRPSAFLFFGIFFAAFLWRKRWKEALIMAGILLLVVGPWVARNYFRHGILFTNATGGLELWVSILPESAGEFQMNEEVSAFLENNGLFKTAERGMREFKRFVFEHPFKYLIRQVEKTLIYFSIIRTSGFWLYLSGLKQLIVIFSSAAFNLFLLVLGSSGFYLLWRHRQACLETRFRDKIFLLLAISMPLSVIPIVVTGRYRYAYLIFLAIGTVISLRFIQKERRIPRFVWFALTLVLLNSSLDVIWHFSKAVSRLNMLNF